ncbi:MAG TPA: sortase [Candidatus Paceibacterota bacterium]|nr:sortase [Candidatus Paceibacterota bacterium]
MSANRKFSIFLIAFFGCSLLAYFVMNGGAYWAILRYDVLLHSPFAPADLTTNTPILDVKTSTEIRLATASSTKSVFGGGYELIIPEIEITTPIVAPQDNTTGGILASLEDGVGIYPGSSDVGTTGRLILLGHSSRASWYRGQYAYVFALLSKLKPLDTFYIAGGGKKFTYQAFSVQTLSPTDTNAVLATTPSDSEVTLITCYPVGSASNRTVVQAKLMSVANI